MSRSSRFSVDQASLLDALPDCVFVIDASGCVRYLNAAVERVLGWDPEMWIGRDVTEVVYVDDLPSVASSIQSLEAKVVGTPVEMRVLGADGLWHWVEVVGTNALLDPEVAGLVCVARDVTQRRVLEVSATDLARFQQVVQVAPSITLLLDARGLVTNVNGAFTRLLGHDPTMVVGHELASFVVPRHAAEMRAAVHSLRVGGQRVALEVPMRVAGNPAASIRPVRFEMVAMTDDPVVGGIVVTGHDVTELHAVRHELEHLARHDPLTQLANRQLLVETLQRLLEFGETFSVLFIDLDRFKPINDLYGHESGDELLQLAARRLEGVVRPNDLVARVGGDEFVVVAPGVGTRDAAGYLAERIEISLNAPYLLEMGPVRVGASIGMALADATSTVASLLADADVEMYDTKWERRGLAGRSSADRRRSATERRRLAEECSAGLQRDEFVAHLQPIIDLRTDRIVRFEALARWQHPRLGLLRPSTFMDLVEDAGFESALADLVLESALVTLIDVGHVLGETTALAVNYSVAQLADPLMVTRVQVAFERHSLAMNHLVVEITEQAMLARRTASGVAPEATLLELHRLGSALSLDDFGTGFSSLTHVRRLPLTEIKIDRSFVDGMCTNPQDLAVVDVIIGLANSLGLRVVAEGVETDEQLHKLRELGCHQAQGYLVGAPMGPDALHTWLRSRAPR